MATKLDRAAKAIIAFFDAREHGVLLPSEIVSILAQQRNEWDLAKTTTKDNFLDFLVTKGKLERIELVSDDYPSVTRYAWGDVTPFEMALSLKRGCYLSHATAVFLYGLNDRLPGTIYVNAEQSPKPEPAGRLTQEAINRAFRGSQRTSRLRYRYQDSTIVQIAGKNTGNLEVGEVGVAGRQPLRVTKLERTLIDIAVRPSYAGGPYDVVDAYRTARDAASVNVLVATLAKLDYRYPYHQVIGCYMKRAGFPENRLDRLKELGLKFDFYLTYGMRDPDYDAEWRLFVPKGF